MRIQTQLKYLALLILHTHTHSNASLSVLPDRTPAWWWKQEELKTAKDPKYVMKPMPSMPVYVFHETNKGDGLILRDLRHALQQSLAGLIIFSPMLAHLITTTWSEELKKLPDAELYQVRDERQTPNPIYCYIIARRGTIASQLLHANNGQIAPALSAAHISRSTKLDASDTPIDLTQLYALLNTLLATTRQVVWYIDGHGLYRKTIAGWPLETFTKFVDSCNQSSISTARPAICTRAMFINSCYIGGYNMEYLARHAIPALKFPLIGEVIANTPIYGELSEYKIGLFDQLAQEDVIDLAQITGTIVRFGTDPVARKTAKRQVPESFPHVVAPGTITAVPLFDALTISPTVCLSRSPDDTLIIPCTASHRLTLEALRGIQYVFLNGLVA